MDPRLVTSQEFRGYLEALGAEHADPLEGFFGASSMSWSVSMEFAVYLGGVRAILMQIANPKVARGVAEHSDFRREPFARLWRTFEAVHAMVFGTRREAVDAAMRVHSVHRRVQGTTSRCDGVQTTYHANDPDLLLWVYATLVDSSIHAYTTFLKPLPVERWEIYYAESKVFAKLFGIGDDRLPEDLAAFDAWMKNELDSARTNVTPTAREIARAILKGPALMRAFQPATYVLAAGTLPTTLREQFQLPWNPPLRAAYRLGVSSVRAIMPHLPRGLRTVPAARLAELRCRG